MRVKRGKAARLAAIALAAALLLALTGCKGSDTVPTLEIPDEQLPLSDGADGAVMQTVVYYADDAGYLVPVTRTIPFEEGVARATLALMVSSEQNDYDAALLGLETLLPAGTQIDLDIASDGAATVSLSPEANTCASALDELNMVNGIVYALTEFDTVSTVRILVDGAETEALACGTDVSGQLVREDLNVETLSQQVTATGVNRVTLFFESAASGAMVPVTRMVFSNDDMETAVLELLKGPRDQSGLLGTMPKGAALISVTREGGVVTVNFSEEFVNVAGEVDGGSSAIKALVLTLSQFEGVESVRILVNGQEWDSGKTTSVPVSINSEDDDSFNFLYD